MATSDSGKKKVVILGGGMAALTTAFELTSRPDWKERFAEISVYQLGWRLGGKARSGCDPATGRVEQFGPHVWFGFYEQAFRLIRQCYAELDRDPAAPLATWRQAFQPQETFAVQERLNGEVAWWTLKLPPSEGQPGDSRPHERQWTELDQCLNWVTAWWKIAPGGKLVGPAYDPEVTQQLCQQWIDFARNFTKHLGGAIDYTRQAEPLLRVLADVFKQLHTALAAHVRQLPEIDAVTRRRWILTDLAMSAMRGAMRDGALLHDFSRLDAWDFRDWLRMHGAAPETVESSLLAGLYGFCFAARGAKDPQPNLAAGVALRFLWNLMFRGSGAWLWQMPAGVGDAVFAPLYTVLHRRGVRFHFFHRVRALRLAADGTRVEAIELDRQATPRAGADRYEPLIDAQGLPCWPRTPLYDRLEEGEELRQRQTDLESDWSDWEPVEQIRLTADNDFDAVVLGISLAALPRVGGELIAAEPAWRRMVEQVPTVPTTVTQWWFRRGASELQPAPPAAFATALPPPLDTWGDLASQPEPAAADPARSVASLRGIWPNAAEIPSDEASNFPKLEQDRAAAEALVWFKQHASELWPKLQGPAIWNALDDPHDGAGEARFRAQFHQALINASDRYVQSAAGSTQFRLSAAQAWFGNLFVCGDWTRTTLNLGCAEAAVLSGRQAAAALCGAPVPDERGAGLLKQ